MHGPGGWSSTSPIQTTETAVLGDPATKLSRPVHCTCPGWCRGRDSADWASCVASCQHCNPKRRRRRAMNAGEGDDGPAD